MKSIKSILFLYFCFLLNTKIEAQEKIQLKIIYNFEHLRDTVSGYRHTEEMALVVAKTITHYYSQTKAKQDSVRKKAFENADATGGRINLGVVVPTTRENFYYSFSEKKLVTQVPFQRDEYLIAEPLDPIKWVIKEKTKKILGFTCQMATTTFKGRVYTAWFSAELPANAGPWKLNGLPGLILEAEDSKDQVSFIAKSILKSALSFIYIPTIGIKTNKADFNKMMQAYENGNVKQGVSQDYSDIKISGVNLAGSGSKKMPNKGINNPIEKLN
ncbi:MAG: GLPGLI family protein [Sphingobacteriia bacterium]|nr:MAG: GLPGLI family protein [Sphingobacteriia bacterium]TAG30982.1 MAG: GLPGLI family protein [Sphingobacteriia bacterium]